MLLNVKIQERARSKITERKSKSIMNEDRITTFSSDTLIYKSFIFKLYTCENFEIFLSQNFIPYDFTLV
jgi:hypothetical protein